MQASTADRSSRRWTREIKSAFTAVWTGRMDNDSFNQLTLSAGMPWRIVTVLRAYCRYLLQTGLPFSQGYIAQVLVNNAAIATRCSPTCSSRASIRDSSDGGAAQRARAARPATSAPRSRKSRAPTRTESCAPCGMRCRRPCAPTPIRPRRDGPAQGIPVLQDREPAAARTAAAEAAVRDLRVLAAHGRRAPAHGLRGARRHSLVGSARGFPHRSTRADEGAAGQEHGHRAGGRQGRLRRQAHCRPSARRSRPK